MGTVEHRWDFCSMCGVMVRCGRCGMNCCSGCFGQLEDGTECPDCAQAYEMQRRGWDDGTAPSPADLGHPEGTKSAWELMGGKPVEWEDFKGLLDPDGGIPPPETCPSLWDE